MNEIKKNEKESSQSRLKILVVAPHPDSRNGIGHYSARLIDELRLQSPESSIMSASDFSHHKSVNKRGSSYARALPSRWPDIFLNAIDANRPHLVHIQHGFYAGHGYNIARFLAGLRARSIPCVITLHGVWKPTFFRRWPVSFYKLLSENNVNVIVHQREETFAVLQEYGIPADRISIIPHGTWAKNEISYPDSSCMNNIENSVEKRKVVLFAGKIFRRKGVHVVIRAFPSVLKRVPDACFIVAGEERLNNVIDWLYIFWLRMKMRQGKKEGWLIRRAEYMSDDELWNLILSSEVTVFPYLRRYGSASGIFHRVIAVGRPVICSHIPTFADAIGAWGEESMESFPPPGDVDAWSRAIINILSDEAFGEHVTKLTTLLGQKTSWSFVAQKHLQLYNSLLSSSLTSYNSLVEK